MINLPVVTLSDKAVIPQNAYKGDAGYDLCSIEEI